MPCVQLTGRRVAARALKRGSARCSAHSTRRQPSPHSVRTAASPSSPPFALSSASAIGGKPLRAHGAATRRHPSPHSMRVASSASPTGECTDPPSAKCRGVDAGEGNIVRSVRAPIGRLSSRDGVHACGLVAARIPPPSPKLAGADSASSIAASTSPNVPSCDSGRRRRRAVSRSGCWASGESV